MWLVEVTSQQAYHEKSSQPSRREQFCTQMTYKNPRVCDAFHMLYVMLRSTEIILLK